MANFDYTALSRKFLELSSFGPEQFSARLYSFLVWLTTHQANFFSWPGRVDLLFQLTNTQNCVKLPEIINFLKRADEPKNFPGV
jgi:hypothetical protein